MMDKCSVCEKPLPSGATHCSVSCLEVERVKGLTKIVAARQSFNTAMDGMLKADAPVRKNLLESEMIILQSGRRNRTEVANSTIICFDENGIARVPHVGCALNDVQEYVRLSRGRVKLLSTKGIIPGPSTGKVAQIPRADSSKAPVVPAKVPVVIPVKAPVVPEVKATPVVEEVVSAPVTGTDNVMSVPEPVKVETKIVPELKSETGFTGRKPVKSKKR